MISDIITKSYGKGLLFIYKILLSATNAAHFFITAWLNAEIVFKSGVLSPRQAAPHNP